MSNVIHIKLTPKAKQEVERIAKARGMNQKAIASKVLEWFGAQDWETQSRILGHLEQPKVQ